jgi:hypothetical protein
MISTSYSPKFTKPEKLKKSDYCEAIKTIDKDVDNDFHIEDEKQNDYHIVEVLSTYGNVHCKYFSAISTMELLANQIIKKV